MDAHRARPLCRVCLMALALVLLFLLSFVWGRYDVPLGQVVRILLSRVFAMAQTWTDNMAIVVWNVRMPRILLAGIMVGSLFSAGTSYIKLVADPSNQLPQITYWLMGSLSGTRMKTVGFAAVCMVVGLLPLLLLRWRMNLLTLSADEARSMGVNTDRLRLVVILSATVLTAASVSVSGMIGWVGLVIPHLSRRLVGNDCRYLLPMSMVFGAAFLLLVDNLARCLTAVEIPIGILTAFVGAPFFVYLMIKGDDRL